MRLKEKIYNAIFIITVSAMTLTFILLFSSVARAGSDTGADFLKIPVGARGVGLGQANTALSYGVQSLNVNPAGIAILPTNAGSPRAGFSFSHQDLFADSSLDHAGFTLATRSPVTVGVSFTRLSQSDQQGRDNEGNPTGDVGASDLAVGTALAYNFGGVQLGTQVKFIRQDLADLSAQGFAVDLGFVSKTPLSRLSLGGSVRNLGPKMKFVREEFDLPLSLTIGAAYQLLRPITVGLDVTSRPNEDQVSVALGSEFQVIQAFSLRAGYLAKVAQAVNNTQRSEITRGSFGDLNGLTAGIGLHVKAFSLDYAMSQFGELGVTHNFTFSTYFGSTVPKDPAFISILQPAEEFEDDDKPAVQQAPQLDPSRVIIIVPLPSSQGRWWE